MGRPCYTNAMLVYGYVHMCEVVSYKAKNSPKFLRGAEALFVSSTILSLCRDSHHYHVPTIIIILLSLPVSADTFCSHVTEEMNGMNQRGCSTMKQMYRNEGTHIVRV